MIRTNRRLLVASLLVVLILAACGSTEETATEETATEETATEETATEETTPEASGLGSLDDLVEAAQAEGTLNWAINGPPVGGAEGMKILEEALNRQYGIDVTLNFVPSGGQFESAGLLIEEFNAGVAARTDVFWASTTVLPVVVDGEVTTPLPVDLFPHITPEQVAEDGHAVTHSSYLPGVMYNTELVSPDEVPRTLQDLLDPKWEGKIASTPYAAQFNYLGHPDQLGIEATREFVQQLASQQLVGLMPCGEASRIASGEFNMLVFECSDKAATEAALEGAPVGFVVLEDFVVVVPGFLIVPPHAEHPNLATLLAGFLLSKEGQQALYEASKVSSHLVEGTPAHEQYQELVARGAEPTVFSSEVTREFGDNLNEWNAEFRDLLAEEIGG